VEAKFLPSNESRPVVDIKIEEFAAFPQISLIKSNLPDPIVDAGGKNTIFGKVRVLTKTLVVVVGG
jgi:hypothetical protein